MKRGKALRYAILSFCTAALVYLTQAVPGHAQSNNFETAVAVNGSLISNYQIDQRVRMLKALNTSGDLRTAAEDALINEQLYLQSAKRLEIEIDNNAVQTGMQEFADRANLTVDQFLVEIGRFGVASESFRDFVYAGLAWREVVNVLFGAKIESVGAEQIDLSIELRHEQKSISVLLSEIIIPLSPETADRAREVANYIYQNVRSKSEFSEFARRASASPSRDNGGDIDWLPLGSLPEPVQNAILGAPNGTVLRPMEMQQALFIFFKRSTREVSNDPTVSSIEFATLAVPGEPAAAFAAANEIVLRVDTCNDLRAEGRESANAFEYFSSSPDEIPPVYATELERLDQGEVAVRSDNAMGIAEIVMLCAVKFVEDDEQRQSALISLRGRKLEEYARAHILDLRASAIIRR